MTAEIKTPLVNALENTPTPIDGDISTWRTYAYKDLAKKLERELTLVTQERDALRKKLDETYIALRKINIEVISVYPYDNHSRALKTEGT